jgi:hypothetical protein
MVTPHSASSGKYLNTLLGSTHAHSLLDTVFFHSMRKTFVKNNRLNRVPHLTWNAERKCDTANLIGWVKQSLSNKRERWEAAYSFGNGCKIRT